MCSSRRVAASCKTSLRHLFRINQEIIIKYSIRDANTHIRKFARARTRPRQPIHSAILYALNLTILVYEMQSNDIVDRMFCVLAFWWCDGGCGGHNDEVDNVWHTHTQSRLELMCVLFSFRCIVLLLFGFFFLVERCSPIFPSNKLVIQCYRAVPRMPSPKSISQSLTCLSFAIAITFIRLLRFMLFPTCYRRLSFAFALSRSVLLAPSLSLSLYVCPSISYPSAVVTFCVHFLVFPGSLFSALRVAMSQPMRACCAGRANVCLHDI